ncbi:MAG: hypothetical protein AB1861_21400 [Cyanobacteriota bacterium]
MKKPRPSNLVIGIFVSILVLFSIFAIGAIINHVSKQVGESNQGLGEPEQNLVN